MTFGDYKDRTGGGYYFMMHRDHRPQEVQEVKEVADPWAAGGRGHLEAEEVSSWAEDWTNSWLEVPLTPQCQDLLLTTSWATSLVWAALPPPLATSRLNRSG